MISVLGMSIVNARIFVTMIGIQQRASVSTIKKNRLANDMSMSRLTAVDALRVLTMLTNIPTYEKHITANARKLTQRKTKAEYSQPVMYGSWMCNGRQIPLVP